MASTDALMRRLLVDVFLFGVLAAMAVGCDRGQRPIPAGAQQVHVEVAGPQVRLEPATVQAGDVYVVLDTPLSSVAFVQRQRSAQEAPGPLSDDDLARLALGDTQGTLIEGFDDAGCTDEQRAEDRGQMGYCGNVFKVAVGPGTYAFLSGDPTGAALPIAVLEVLP